MLIRTTKDKTDEVAKKEIEEIAKSVSAKNFAKVADQKSEDPYGKGKGGYLGRFGRGRMMPEFEKVAFALKPGTISEPVKTNYGYHLILVENKFEAKEATLAEYSNLLVKELIQKESKDELQKLTDTLSTEIKNALLSGKASTVQEMQKKYSFTYEEGKNMNELEEEIGPIALSSENLNKIFSVKVGQKDAFLFTDANFIKIVYVSNENKTDAVTAAVTTDIEKEKESEQKIVGDDLKMSTMKYLRDNVKITVYKKLL
ncbi:MAG: peptidyl-prolyl cis-trans isomerase [Oligoflexia bacterium]|nr:peptidyl-prolyl cis-trans isomerase [Oligoflexia bacterium]